MISRRQVVRFAFALALTAGFFGSATAHQGDRFYIVGFVQNPGAYVLKANMTVGDALETAGGFAPSRTATSIEIIRVINGEKSTLAAGLADAVQANDTISVK